MLLVIRSSVNFASLGNMRSLTMHVRKDGRVILYHGVSKMRFLHMVKGSSFLFRYSAEAMTFISLDISFSNVNI